MRDYSQEVLDTIKQQLHSISVVQLAFSLKSLYAFLVSI